MIAVFALCAIVMACAGSGEGKWRGLSGESNPNNPTQCSEPRFYVEEGSYSDGSEFWSSLASNLKKKYGMGRSVNAKGCRQYRDEESFLAVLSMVRDKGDPSPTDLEEKVNAFCEAHSNDSRVDEAYNCSTGCPLADLLNQICLQARPPPCIEPVPDTPCTNTFGHQSLSCGNIHKASLREWYYYVFEPCGYPRCPGACDFTLTVDGVSDAELHRLAVLLSYVVKCPDTLTVYGGSTRNDDNILLNSPCTNGSSYSTLTAIVKVRTFTIALDKSPGGYGKGFAIKPFLMVY